MDNSKSVSGKWHGTPEQAFGRTGAILKEFISQGEISGPALQEVHERKLWKLHYASFDEYREKYLGISKTKTYRLLSDHKLLLEPPLCQDKPIEPNVPKKNASDATNKGNSNASPMPLKTEKHRGNGKTDQNIGEDNPTKIIELDASGYPIPEEALEFWHRSQDVQDLMTAVSKAKTAIENAKKADDPLFRCVSPAAIDHLSRAYQYLTDAKPYAVCLYCQGHYRMNKGCLNCKGVGLVSKFSYEKNAPEELRIIRERAIEAKQ